MPTLRASSKATSRFGPVLPWVWARASVWHEPHFWVNMLLPFTRSGVSLLPHPASRVATIPARAILLGQVALTRREAYPLGRRRGALGSPGRRRSSRLPWAAAITPPRPASQPYCRRAVSDRAAAPRPLSEASRESQRTSFAAIS